MPSSDKRDYVKALRSMILDTIDDDTPSNGPPSFGTSPTTSHPNLPCQPSRVLMYSIKDGKTVLCGLIIRCGALSTCIYCPLKICERHDTKNWAVEDRRATNSP